MRFLRPVLAIVLIGTIFVVDVSPAAACSCDIPEVQRSLAASDGAFVGTFLGRGRTDDGPEWLNTEYRFEVDEWIKGGQGDRISVWSAADGAACGLEVREGQQAGLFLRSENGRAVSDLCSTVPAGTLLAAVAPVQIGEGPVHFLLTGKFQEGNLAMLDSEGRPLGYLGRRVDYPGRLQVCPGGNTALVFQLDRRELDRIDLHTGTTVALSLPAKDVGWVVDHWCADDTGQTYTVLFQPEAREGFRMHHLTVVGNKVTEIEVPARSATMVGSTIGVVEEPVRGVQRASLFDVETGERTMLMTVRGDPAAPGYALMRRPVLSPDRQRILVTEDGSDGEGTVFRHSLFDAGSGTAAGQFDAVGQQTAFFIDDDRIGITTSDDRGSFQNLEVRSAEDLALLGTVTDWNSAVAVAAGDRIWGISEGSIVSVDPTGESEKQIMHPSAALTGTLVAVEPFALPESAVAPIRAVFEDEDEATPVFTDRSEADTDRPAADRTWFLVAGIGFVALLAAGTWVFRSRTREQTTRRLTHK